MPFSSIEVEVELYPKPDCKTSKFFITPSTTFAFSFAPFPDPFTTISGTQYPLPPSNTDTEVIPPSESNFIFPKTAPLPFTSVFSTES